MAQTPEQRREYQRQWKAKKLAEDPDYFNRYDREYRKAHPEATREKQRRSFIAGRERQKQWVAKNRDRVREYQRRWKADHRDEMREYMQQWHAEHREQVNARKREQYRDDPAYRAMCQARAQTKQEMARRALRFAVRRGWIVKPDACADCGAQPGSRRLHAHHDDYDRPFDVEWLCSTCHGKRHRLT